MEGGSSVVTLITYGILGIVMLAILVLTVRALRLAVGLVSLTLADMLGRWPPVRRWLERWAARHAAKRTDR
jgi:glutathione S-transferase